MPPENQAVRHLAAAGIIYVAFLFLVGELPFRPGDTTAALLVVWCTQAAWEIWSVLRARHRERGP